MFLEGEEDFFWIPDIRMGFGSTPGLLLRVSCLVAEEDFFWIRLVFSRRGGLILDPSTSRVQ